MRVAAVHGMKLSMLLPIALCGTSLMACATDVPPEGAGATEGDTQTQSSELRKQDPDDPGPDLPDDPPPPPPTGPVAQGRLVRITSGELNVLLQIALGGTRLVVDTTGTSSTILGDPVYSCRYPNQAAREAAQAECFAGPPSYRAECLRQMNIDFPNIKECSSQRPPVHSYVDFAPYAESLGAVDVPFDNMKTIERDTWGPGGIKVDINNVNATINGGTLFSYFSPELSNRATASVWLTLSSNQPTLPCAHTSSVLGCPDIELTNMKILVRLTGLKPVVGDPTQLGFDQALATFYFDRNLNNIPDWMLTELVDIDAIIKNNVQANIEKALGGSSGRAALQKALTGLVNNRVKSPTVGGVQRFYKAWYETGRTLVVDYEPAPPAMMMMMKAN